MKLFKNNKNLTFSIVILLTIVLSVISSSNYYTSIYDKEIDNLKVIIDDLHTENDGLKESNNEKSKEIENLKQDQDAKQKALIENKDQIFNLNQNLNKIKDERNSLKEEISKYKSELKKYKSKKTASSGGKEINVVATAYTAFCDTGCTGITATGHDVRGTIYKDGLRVIAVDSSVVPLGSKVKVETETMSFTGIAEDTGGEIKGNKIDVLVKSKDIAYNFGKQKAKITVLN